MGAIKDLINDVTGKNLEPCPGKTDMGVKCKKKKRPGYPGCGSPLCSSSHGF